MFTTTPWKDYFLIVCLLFTGYYLFVGFKFYRSDLWSLIKDIKNKSPDQRFESTDSGASEPVDPGPTIQNDETTFQDTDEKEPQWQNEELFIQLEDLAAKLKNAIGEACEKQYEKQELILLIKMILKEYPALYGLPFQFAISNVIESECAKYGSMHLSADDKVMIWNQVD